MPVVFYPFVTPSFISEYTISVKKSRKEAVMNQNNIIENPRSEGGLGHVIVKVTTARGAIPIENAEVYVRDYSTDGEVKRGDILGSYKTNSSGATERISLPTAPKSLSISPGNKGTAYKTYNIDVHSDGFYDQFYVNVPIFDGITAIQSVDLIPLPENGRSDGVTPDLNRFFESENPAL